MLSMMTIEKRLEEKKQAIIRALFAGCVIELQVVDGALIIRQTSRM